MKRKTILKEPAGISYQSLCKESDKGCVIIIGSILEEHLGQLHEAFIAKSIHPSKVNIFGELCDPFAPLSTFAGKLKLAYAYGLIDVDDYKDLDLIRKLRNEAAHTVYDFNLGDAGAKSIIKKLTAMERYRKSWDSHKDNLQLIENRLTLPPMKNAQRDLILNFLALQGFLSMRIADGIEAYMIRRQGD